MSWREMVRMAAEFAAWKEWDFHHEAHVGAVITLEYFGGRVTEPKLELEIARMKEGLYYTKIKVEDQWSSGESIDERARVELVASRSGLRSLKEIIQFAADMINGPSTLTEDLRQAHSHLLSWLNSLS